MRAVLPVGEEAVARRRKRRAEGGSSSGSRAGPRRDYLGGGRPLRYRDGSYGRLSARFARAAFTVGMGKEPYSF